MATTIFRSPGLLEQILLNKLLFICGIVSSLVYIAANIFVPMQYPGYDLASQTVSELSAVGAPTRQLWVELLGLYSILVVGFGWGIWRSSLESRTRRAAGMLIAVFAIVGVFWPPMHTREIIAAGGGTLTDTLHIVFTFITVPLMLVVIGLSAASLGKAFRIYSITSLVIVVAFGVLTGLDSPRMEANLPTPWMGVWERISIGAYMVWMIVLATLMLRTKQDESPSRM